MTLGDDQDNGWPIFSHLQQSGDTSTLIYFEVHLCLPDGLTCTLSDNPPGIDIERNDSAITFPLRTDSVLLHPHTGIRRKVLEAKPNSDGCLCCQHALRSRFQGEKVTDYSSGGSSNFPVSKSLILGYTTFSSSFCWAHVSIRRRPGRRGSFSLP